MARTEASRMAEMRQSMAHLSYSMAVARLQQEVGQATGAEKGSRAWQR